MSYAIVFSSKTGNTELLADTLHNCLPQADCYYFGSPNPAAMEADTLYVCLLYTSNVLVCDDDQQIVESIIEELKKKSEETHRR